MHNNVYSKELLSNNLWFSCLEGEADNLEVIYYGEGPLPFAADAEQFEWFAVPR